jgi:hypothetical protein
MMFEDVLGPMELKHVSYKKGRSYADSVGAAVLEATGKRELASPGEQGRPAALGCIGA